MARLKKDHEFEASKARIEAALQIPAFAQELLSFAAAVHHRGVKDAFDSQNIEEDKERGWIIYYGLYYFIREHCDRYGLWWQKDQKYIRHILVLLTSGESMADAVAHAFERDTIGDLHWQWFRMARTGLNLPRLEEIHMVRHSGTSLHGFTVREIVDFLKVSEGVDINPRTVQIAIADCWSYLEHNAIFVNRLQELAGLSDQEALMLPLDLFLRTEERRQRREGRGEK